MKSALETMMFMWGEPLEVKDAAEVLEADAFSLFKEKGIFNREVAQSFRDNILSKGSTEDEAVLYRRFRGHDPQPKALLDKLGITQVNE